MLTRFRSDILAALLLLALSIAFLWPVVGGGKTLLPVDNLYQYLPWQAQAAATGASTPYNALLSDLILENYPWKHFIVDSLQSRQLPLWNPYLFGGVPFLAAGQQSALYPLSILFYVIPLTQAFGYFAVLTLFLAALNMYILARVLGAGPVGGVIAGVSYAFSSFFVVSIVFPMIISAAAWLPLLLVIAELLARRNAGRAPLLIAGGAIVVGIQFLAGHVEIAYYNMMVLGFYTLARAIMLWRERRSVRPGALLIGQMAVIVMLGVGLAGVQIVPLFELVRTSFRQGSASYSDVVGWAYPLRQIVTFFIPDFYGNPSHHSYFDLVERTSKAAPTVFWGIKNYVEAGSYVGILPLLLAVVAILRRVKQWGIFTLLAVLSLLFAFGTPLYAALFYGLPGYNQLHSAFRWVYPFTLCMSLLAGMAFGTRGRGDAETRGREDAETRGREDGETRGREDGETRGHGDAETRGHREGDTGARRVAIAAAVGGVVGLLVMTVAALYPAPFVGVADAVLRRSNLAQAAFASGQMFFSYEAHNLLLFFAFLAGAGVVILLALRRWRWWPVAAIALLVIDLFSIGYGFNPRSDPKLLDQTPPAVAFLQQDKDIFRVGTLDMPDQKLFNQNSLMPYGIQDIRGYDSIIPRRYTEYMNMIEGQGELLYNRISPFYWAGSLDSALVDLLNVKYIATTQRLSNPKLSLVYDGEVLIYQNKNVLPRAFLVQQAQVITDEAALKTAMKSLNPTKEVLIEEAAVFPHHPDPSSTRNPATSKMGAWIRQYTPNKVTVEVSLPWPSYLVLSDSYFPGWIADLRPAGKPDADAVTVPILRADYNFRAVALDAGEYEVTFRYSPLSLRVGMLASVLSFVILLLIGATMVWGRLYHDEGAEGGTVRRVAKNSLLPMIANLTSRLVSFGFAIITVRILGAEGQGKYGLAVVVIGYFDILTQFGLNALLTREVAADRSKGNFYLSNTIVLRLLLWLASLPMIAAYIYLMKLPWDTALAIILFAVMLVPSNLAQALSSVFNAYEKMEYPAAVTIITTVLQVALGTTVLLAGWGIVGLAATSIAVNLATVIMFLYPLSTRFFRPHLEFSAQACKQMMVQSYPLMINHLLATVFYKIDAVLMKPLIGGEKADAALGYYSTAYKFIDGLNIIPSYLTMAIFPLMSRYARETNDALRRAYILSLRLLVILALPLSVGTCLLADRIILISFGAKMLPQSGQALAIVIWFLPFSFINSVTQYALIAVNQQHYLTRAFIIGAVFNVVANVLLIPRYGFQGAALTTVLSEIVLFVPFYYSVRKNITTLPFAELFWRPVVASVVMGGVIWLLRDASLLLVTPAAMLVYAVMLLALGALTQEDWELVKKAVHG